MKKKLTILIFTDLDGSLLDRDTFKFDTIKNYVKSLVNDGIIIIPNSSKTEKEIEKFLTQNSKSRKIKQPYLFETQFGLFLIIPILKKTNDHSLDIENQGGLIFDNFSTISLDKLPTNP